MKRLLKKKISFFGKEVSVFVVVLLAVGLVSAALIPYFGLITGLVTVSGQGLLVDGQTYSQGDIIDSYSDFTSLENPVYVREHTLENNAEVQADGIIVSECVATGTVPISACDDPGMDYRAVEYFDDAGADFSDYATNGGLTCTSTVDANTLGSNSGWSGTVCVSGGTYTGNVNVPANVILVAVNAPNSTTPTIIDGQVTLSASSTLKGFRIEGLSVTGAKSAIHVSASDVTVDSNVVYDMTGNGLGTIKGIHVYSTTGISNIVLTNNLIEKIYDTGKGSVGIMVQGNLNVVTVTYNTVKDIKSDATTPSWDYATGIEVTPTGGYVGSPLGIVVTDNHIEDIVSVVEPGRGFALDWYDENNDADANQITLERNNFVDVLNDITSKDQNLAHTLDATDNWFGLDGINVNVNGVAKHEIGIINADWMTKTDFSVVPSGVDEFATLASFPKMLYPNTLFTLTTEVKPSP